ncbi:hypothetical protein OF83DRAFT_1174249 [Amylostereum chailletii]|nr:hypothetical protein OF83DRAFT_1174249 [Amylostereum chailletii]
MDSIKIFSRDQLHPVSPAHNRRYEGTGRVSVAPALIEATMYSSSKSPLPPYLGRDWQCCIHPEGKPYFYRQAQFTVVTEAPIYNPAVASCLNGWLAFIEEAISDLHFVVSVTAELWLEIDKNTGHCNYYFVDHATRAIFWLENIETEVLDLPGSVSHSHLKYALEENYWNHVETYPMHLEGLPTGALDELIIIFMHARADQMTSTSSTFPYTKEECVAFLDLLSHSRDEVSDGRVITYVARLWTVVSNFRFITHYGEEHCRLSRNQSIIESPEPKKSIALNLTSTVLFNLPKAHQERLEDLFVDDLVYRANWQAFISNLTAEWKLCMQWTFALLMCNALTTSHVPSIGLTQSSMALCIAGLIFSTVLSHQHQHLERIDTGEAASYLSDRRTATGFRPLAIVYSLPKALFVWALVLFAIQAACMAFCSMPFPCFVLSVSVVAAASVAVWRTITPRPARFEPEAESGGLESTWSSGLLTLHKQVEQIEA